VSVTNIIQFTKATAELRPSIVSLLRSEKLPVEDLPLSMENFFVAMNEDELIGAIGLEQYESYGLLRSVVVNHNFRNMKIASELVSLLERYAITKGIDSMYLLTVTASQYFDQKGYETESRENVPLPVRASSEFSHNCPASAIVMKKHLK
jgi:amino-acid N-acetyltransferase